MATTSKLDKNELKRLMREEKAKRIESPLAKYNAANQLTCVICNQIIKSELHWSAHINSKAHFQQVELFKSQAKSKKPETQSQQQQQQPVVQHKSESTSFKRPLPVSTSGNVDVKKAKYDDMKAKQAIISQYEDEEEEFEEEISEKHSEKMDVSEDVSKKPEVKAEVQEEETHPEAAPSASSLPAGFFDDPRLDAKARHINVKETMENEWEKFKKEIQQEEHKNEVLNEIDDEVREIDRDLEEVDELIHKWSRIEELHKRKESILSKAATRSSAKPEKDSSRIKKDEESSSDNSDIEDLDQVIGLRLRAKKRY